MRAVELVRVNRMSARAAAELCNVPRSTLWDRLNKLKTPGSDEAMKVEVVEIGGRW
jgi:transposase